MHRSKAHRPTSSKLAMVQLDQEPCAPQAAPPDCCFGQVHDELVLEAAPDGLDNAVLATVETVDGERRSPPRSPGGGTRLGSDWMENKVIEK